MKSTTNVPELTTGQEKWLEKETKDIANKYVELGQDPDLIPQYYLDIGLNHFSPTQLNAPIDIWLFKYVYLSQVQRRSLKINSRMHSGNCLQHALNLVYLEGIKPAEALGIGLFGRKKKYEPDMATYIGNGANDIELHEQNIQAFEATFWSGIEALEELKLPKDKSVTSETYVHVTLDGIHVPILGRTDFQYTDVIELKTKWRKKNRPKKDGSYTWAKSTAPDKPDRPFWTYLKQCAFYWKATGKNVHLVYACERGKQIVTRNDEGKIISKKDGKPYAIFNKENSEHFSDESLNDCINQFKVAARARQTLLQHSTNPKDLVKFIAEPDLKHFMWDVGDDFYQQGKELFYGKEK